MAYRKIPAGRGGTASPEAASSLVPPELQDRVDYLLCKIADTAKRNVDTVFAQLGIRGAHHAVLRVVARLGPTPQYAIAARLHVDGSTIVDLADFLEKKGLVVRVRSRTDRRVQLVQITDDGTRCLAEADKLAATLQQDVFAALPTVEYENLRGILIELARYPHSAGTHAIGVDGYRS